MQPDLFLNTTRCLAFPSRAGFAVNKTWLVQFWWFSHACN